MYAKKTVQVELPVICTSMDSPECEPDWKSVNYSTKEMSLVHILTQHGNPQAIHEHRSLTVTLQNRLGLVFILRPRHEEKELSTHKTEEDRRKGG